MKRLFLCALFAAVFATVASYAQTISSADLPPIKPIEKMCLIRLIQRYIMNIRLGGIR